VAPPVLGLVQHAADKSLLIVTWRRAVHFAMSLLILPGPLLLSPSGPPLLLRAALGEQARRLRALCGRGRSAMENRGGVPLALHTADGAVLSAILLQPAPAGPGGGGAPQPRRVVLRLNGNSEAWEMADRDAVQGYLDQGYTVPSPPPYCCPYPCPYCTLPLLTTASGPRLHGPSTPAMPAWAPPRARARARLPRPIRLRCSVRRPRAARRAGGAAGARALTPRGAARRGRLCCVTTAEYVQPRSAARLRGRSDGGSPSSAWNGAAAPPPIRPGSPETGRGVSD
jgi:hypothetical protein